MITSKLALALLGLAGFVIGPVLIFSLWNGVAGMYAARSAQIYDEPARAIFVGAAIALATVPVLGALSWLAFRLARASTPLKRGLAAWGWSILAAIPGMAATIVASLVWPPMGGISSVYVVIGLYAIACGAIWVGVARSAMKRRPAPTYPRLEDIK